MGFRGSEDRGPIRATARSTGRRRGGPGLRSGSSGPPPLRAILFDLDGTLTRPRSSWQHIHEALGMWSGRAERYQERFRCGDISYEEFCRLDAEEWRGMSVDRLRTICDAVPYNPGAKEMLAALRARRLLVGIVSTGLSLLADRVREEHRLDHAESNHLEARDGVLTGRVVISIEHGGKGEALRRFCAKFWLDPRDVAAVGDTEGDVSMFREAGWSVAFNPADAGVEREARAVVRGTDLLSLIPAVLSQI